MPFAYYAGRSFYTMHIDAYDRFSTRLEQRFTRRQITDMLEQVGLERVSFSEAGPLWCAVAYKPAG